MGLVEKLSENWPPQAWQDVHLAVALSGGADSVALLRRLAELKRQHGGKGELIALHVNHQLRGKESDGDAQWCVEFCRSLEVACKVLEANVAERADADGDGLEAAARDERYRLLTEACERQGVRYLATAHSRDDNIETVLFRLLRGTGLRGLAGIATTRPLTHSLSVVRPLLSCSRAEIIEYLTVSGQDFRTDSSNASLEFTRNRIRNELLPMLRSEFNANVDESIERLAEQAGQLQSFMEGQASQLLEKSCEWTTDVGFALNTTTLNAYPPLLTVETLRLAWRRVGLPEQAMTHRLWGQLAGLVSGSASTGVLNMPGNIRAERAGDILVIERAP